VEQILNTEHKDFFSGIIANPTEVGAMHAPQLKTLVELYPQSGILRAMLARASQDYDQGGFQQRLKSAAVYAPDRSVLYNLINYPEKLIKYSDPAAVKVEEEEKVSLFEHDYSNYQENGDTNAYTEELVYEEEPINYFHESEEVFQPGEDHNESYNNQAAEEQVEQPRENTDLYNYNAELSEPIEQAPVSDYAYNRPVQHPEELIEQQPVYNYEQPVYHPEELLQPEPYTYTAPTYEEQVISAASEIDDEIYDEITGIEDIYIQPISKQSSATPVTEAALEDILYAQYGQIESVIPVLEQPQVEYQNTQPEPQPIVAPEQEYTFSPGSFRDRMEASSNNNDEVEFEMVIDAPVKPEPVAEPVKPAPAPSAIKNIEAVTPQFTDDDARVSRYNDDKMPYSFMWWLDKTRKEHAETHQPYVPFKPITQEVERPAATDQLQQQYFENIFHITSVEQLDIHTRGKRKESEIIDRFIQKDPQLKPPNTEKLDNENKAKQSSEDKDELVSETLARIYHDQMLYTKAISTYQKLLLKFPEKSSYFVAQIKLLEKKIN
jgi:hypothetical protein